MRAYQATEAGLIRTDIAQPTPIKGEVLVSVEAIALNRGESRRAVHGGFAPETVPGWDSAGRIIAAGPETDAPAPGTRIVARGLSGAWAEARVVSVEDIAVIPDGVDSETAASIITPATTALAILNRYGDISGRRVLVTAANGAVGRMAIQLARLGGAEVIAMARAPRSGQLEALGAARVVSDLADVKGPVDLVVESLGGPVLVQAANLLGNGGCVQSFGWSMGEPASFTGFDRLMKTGGRLQGFAIGELRVGNLLDQLVQLVAQGKLDCGITRRASWSELAKTAAETLDPGFGGKAVLKVDAA